ncbi:unnamed protein product [Cyprideis torosa]|uniref:Uncharacterized protein n=1 Tax=Cyprideis torosa TaxID=163714 RepID=A0A7R8WSM1_9CRUS|nr:unnamed protein product [Cyprideis torosa]CAG0909508.1 unnamed protein product [Cyprideis torosa]
MAMTYCSIHSQAGQLQQKKAEEAQKQLEQLTNEELHLDEQLLRARAERGEDPERDALVVEERELEEKLEALQKKLINLRKYDFNALQKEIQVAKTAANRWTDNIFSIKQWCRNKFNIEEQTLDKQFEIPPDLDYID